MIKFESKQIISRNTIIPLSKYGSLGKSVLSNFLCKQISTQFQTIYYQCNSIGIITNDGSARCSRCDEEFSDYEKFEEHSDRKGCQKKQGFKCDECNSLLRTKKSLQRHMLNKHTQHR